jgi:hypothetical protein
MLSFLENVDEKDGVFVKEILLAIKPKIINLFQEQNASPMLRYFLLSNTNSEEFTLLIREIPECIVLLCNIDNPTFFPLIQFEKLSPEHGATIQLQLIENLIQYDQYHDQLKGYPTFFTPTHHAEDSYFISTLKSIIKESEKSNVGKISSIKMLINEHQALLSIYIKKLLADRQFSENTSAHGEKPLLLSSSC